MADLTAGTRNRVGALAAGALVLLAAGARASADEPVKSWFQLITVDAYASVSYTWNFNEPQSGMSQLRAFDYDHNSFRIDAAEVTIQKAVANRGEFGFRLDVTYGAVARTAAARGLFRDVKTGVAGDVDLLQAFGSYIVPIGKGLRIDAGKFLSPVGAESLDRFDGLNDEFSRSWLFTFAPYTHTGIKLSYPFSDKFAAMVMVINGWDNVVDNNAAKSFGASLAITPVAALAVYLNYIGGPERDKNDTDFRHLADLVAVYHATQRLTLTLNFDYGYESGGAPLPAASLPLDTMGMPVTAPTDAAAAKPKDAQWAGLALYLRLQATRRFALCARGEIFWDFDGNRTGVVQRLISGTLVPEFRINDSFIVRAEVRIDGSNHHVFEKSDGSKGNYQPTVALNAQYVF